MSQYIILDLFNPDIVNVECDDDGYTMYFDYEKEAQEYIDEYGVQEPLIVKL